MRKLVRTAAMIALLFTTTVGMANKPKISVVSNEDTSTFVYELDSNSGKTTITFMDEDQNIIFYENLAKGANAKKFDLSRLENGLYFFKSEDELKETSYTILVKGKKMEVLGKVEKSKPVYRVDDRMVYLNFLNLDAKDVAIEVYDNESRLVFSEKRTKEMTIEKAFDFTKAYDGEYTVVVRDSKESYYKNIAIE